MKENKVTSLELSKELAPLGIKQDSEFFWCQYRNGKWGIEPKCFIEALIEGDEISDEYYSAFLSDELLEMLPIHTHISKYVDDFLVQADYAEFHKEYDSSLSNALAKILIYMLKNKILEIDDLNDLTTQKLEGR